MSIPPDKTTAAFEKFTLIVPFTLLANESAITAPAKVVEPLKFTIIASPVWSRLIIFIVPSCSSFASTFIVAFCTPVLLTSVKTILPGVVPLSISISMKLNIA